MPREGSSRRDRRRGAPNSSMRGDFTVYDYAHSSGLSKLNSKGERVKKGDSKLLYTEVKQLKSALDAMELAWYEKDIDDFDTFYIGDEVQHLKYDDDDDDNVTDYSIDKSEKCVKSMTCIVQSATSNNELVSNSERMYPIDLWFLIGRYIEPEYVGLFASLCRDTCTVTRSAQFWQNLYRRYYSPTADLPQTLSLSCIDRPHGLRTRVVRSLHYLYPPYKQRKSSIRDIHSYDSPQSLVSLDSLLGATCISHWYEMCGGVWRYYWKFCRRGRTACVENDKDLLADADIAHNVDEGCTILQVGCPNFSPVPHVSGMVLVKVEASGGYGLSSDGSAVRSYSLGHRLNLQFNTRYVKAKVGGGAPRGGERNEECVLDPVKKVHVIHWWNKNFNGTMNEHDFHHG